MADLPPVLGHFTRIRVVVLVTGRTSVSRMAGVTAVRRHVATAGRLGLEPIVLYPARMKALGAEIAGEIDGRARCLPSDALADEAGDDGELALVIAGDWYISPSAIVGFSNETRGPAVARFRERGRVVAPLARMRVKAIRNVIPKLADHASGELINEYVDDDARIVTLPVSERHRLSDNVAVARCEAKLFGWLGSARDPWHVRTVHKTLAVPMTRWLTATSATPTQVSAAKTLLGLTAACLLLGTGYLAGLAGAFAYFFSRVLDTVCGDLSRAAVVEGARGEKADVVGDVAVMLAILAAVVSRSTLAYASWLGLAAAAGIATSAVLSYLRVFRQNWQAAALGVGWSERQRIGPNDHFTARFWRRNGLAYAIVFAALVGRLDLFLWAAAIGAHLFYVLWLITDARTSR